MLPLPVPETPPGGRCGADESEASPQPAMMGGSPPPTAPHRQRLCWLQQGLGPDNKATRPLAMHHLGVDGVRQVGGGDEPIISDGSCPEAACTAPVSSVVDVCLGEAVRLQYTLMTRAVWAVALHELRLMDTLRALR